MILSDEEKLNIKEACLNSGRFSDIDFANEIERAVLAKVQAAAIPEYYQEEWKRNVMLMWSCVRKHDSSIPSDVLDFMREFLLSAAQKPEGK